MNPLGFFKLFQSLNPMNPSTPLLPDLIVSAAESQIGVHEVSNNQAPEIDKYWKATSYQDGMKNREPWCAAFVCWCVKTAIDSAKSRGAKFTFERPQSAAAFGWEGWCRGVDNSAKLQKPASDFKRGDIVIFSFSHIGIVYQVDGNEILTIEGNTNKAGEREGTSVLRKRRGSSLVRSRIRFTV